MQNLTRAVARVGALAFTKGGRLSGVLTGTGSLTAPSLAAGATGTVTLAVTGAVVGDIVILEPPTTLEANLAYNGAAVTATGVVTALFANPSASAVAATAKTWTYRLIRTS